MTWQFVKLTGKEGKQISLVVVLIIVIAVVMLIFWATKIRAKKVEDRSPELSASVIMKCKICGQDNPPEAGFCANCGATLVATVEPPPPAAAPAVAVEYVGGMTRLGAAIIDGGIVFAISFVLFWLPRFANWVPIGFLLLLYHWLFIGLKGQTLGKMAVGIKVVNAQGDRPALGVAALREILGKLVSTIVLFVGFLWIDWDREKQGWHDKIAGTHVVKVVKAKSTE